MGGCVFWVSLQTLQSEIYIKWYKKYGYFARLMLPAIILVIILNSDINSAGFLRTCSMLIYTPLGSILKKGQLFTNWFRVPI